MKKLLPILIALPVFLVSLLLLRPEPTTPVVTAARDLPEGTMLTASDVTTRQVPKSQVPNGALSDTSTVTGQTLRVFRGEGDVINPSHFGGEVITLAADERAVAIHVTDAAGLAGLIRPGDNVGVTAVMDSQDGSFAKTVVTGLRVLYISPEFRAVQGSSPVTASTNSGSSFTGGISTVSKAQRDQEGTVVLAVPVSPVTIGYDFSAFGINSESILTSMTDLLPALDLVDSVQLSLFLEPDTPQPFLTSGIMLPSLVITPAPTPTATPCPNGPCLPTSPASTQSIP
jgi:pilus assembly protein CpaB